MFFYKFELFQNQFFLKNFALLSLDEISLLHKVIESLKCPKIYGKHMTYVAFYFVNELLLFILYMNSSTATPYITIFEKASSVFPIY